MVSAVNTRYLTIRLQVDGQTFGGANGTSNVKYITCNSGVADDGDSYLSAEIVIQKSLGFIYDTATIVLRGMAQSDINTFRRTNLMGEQFLNSDNQVTIYAGYTLGSDGLPPVVYQGFVTRAGEDPNLGRDRPFVINLMQNFNHQNQIGNPVNPQNQISLDTLFKTIATNIGYKYQSTGVTGTVSNIVLWNKTEKQKLDIIYKYGYHYKTNLTAPNEFTLFVAKKGQPLIDSQFVLSADNGMIGWPIVEDMGFSARCYFNPNLQIGQAITLQSEELTTVNNKISVNNLNLYINAMQITLQNKESDWVQILQLNAYSGTPGG